jgi:hypothetical protein
MVACLGLHDFSVVNSRLDVLCRLKDRFPNFKLSLFTVPVDQKSDWGISTIRYDLLREVKDNLGWMQLIPHGYAHDGSEMRNCDYGEFKRAMESIDSAFKMDGLPYEKGFAAPHWRWSHGVVKALDEMGWWGAVSPHCPDMYCTRRFYRYSHLINERLDGEVLKLHGHVYGTKNDVGRCFNNLAALPPSTEWRYVTDFLEES